MANIEIFLGKKEIKGIGEVKFYSSGEIPLDLYVECFKHLHKKSGVYQSNSINTSSTCVFIAKVDNIVIGYVDCDVDVYAGYNHITYSTACIYPKFRGFGLYSELYKIRKDYAESVCRGKIIECTAINSIVSDKLKCDGFLENGYKLIVHKDGLSRLKKLYKYIP